MDDGELDGLLDGQQVVVQRVLEFTATVRRDGDRLVLDAVDGEQPELAVGERVRIRTAVPGDASYVADARVVEAPSAPGDGWQVQSPGEFERQQQRRFVRIAVPDVELRVREPEEGGTARTGDLVNLSAGGVRAAGELEVSPGQHLRVVFDLPQGRHAVHLDLLGEVVWTRPSPGGRTLVGVQFLDVDEPTQARITSWIYQREAGGRRDGT